MIGSNAYKKKTMSLSRIKTKHRASIERKLC